METCARLHQTEEDEEPPPVERGEGGGGEQGFRSYSNAGTTRSEDLLALSENELLRFGVCPRLWKDVKVGDLILCLKNECFPADMVLLTTSDTRGGAFIETASLDGETNLKLKQTHHKTFEWLSDDLAAALHRVFCRTGELSCQPPNRDLHVFEGVLELGRGAAYLPQEGGETDKRAAAGKGGRRSSPVSRNPSGVGGGSGFLDVPEASRGKGGGMTNSENNMVCWLKTDAPLSAQQLLLRGCKLRNTEWALGMVVYTGKETKIQMVGRRGVIEPLKRRG